jgi:membrane protease YdiL (CAAX protease family)
MAFSTSRQTLRKVIDDLENESNTFRQSPEGKKIDFKLIIIIIATALSLTIIHYWGPYSSSLSFFRKFSNTKLYNQLNTLFYHSSNGRLWQLTHWITILTFGYLIMPVLIIKFIFKEPLSHYGLSFKNPLKDYKWYLIMLLVMVPLVIVASYSKSFQLKYPFYHITNSTEINTNFFIWELEYFFQFFALEFFFRGFLLHGIKHRFGFYSVLVMNIPYCMIHFGKPMPEAIAAILAGIILGTLSLKSKNIWLGVLIHCSVALTMDLCSLWQKGILF